MLASQWGVEDDLEPDCSVSKEDKRVMRKRKKPHAFVQQDVDLHLMDMDEYIRNCVEGQKPSIVNVIQILVDNG